MSFDLNLATVCNHRIHKELVTLESDRRSLRVNQPIASSNVGVYASDNLLPKNMYILIFDPETINIQQPRMIYLNKPWKSVEDYFEVTYVTLAGFCPKCVGVDKIDDISYDVRGHLLTIRNEGLLLQNMEKFTVTELESNPFHTFIGTTLIKLLGQKITDTTFLSAKITQEVSSTLNVLKDLQRQLQYTNRPITDGELLDTVSDVKVSFDNNDPTIIRTDVTAKAVSGKTVSYSQYLRIN